MGGGNLGHGGSTPHNSPKPSEPNTGRPESCLAPHKAPRCFLGVLFFVVFFFWWCWGKEKALPHCRREGTGRDALPGCPQSSGEPLGVSSSRPGGGQPAWLQRAAPHTSPASEALPGGCTAPGLLGGAMKGAAGSLRGATEGSQRGHGGVSSPRWLRQPWEGTASLLGPAPASQTPVGPRLGAALHGAGGHIPGWGWVGDPITCRGTNWGVWATPITCGGTGLGDGQPHNLWGHKAGGHILGVWVTPITCGGTSRGFG